MAINTTVIDSIIRIADLCIVIAPLRIFRHVFCVTHIIIVFAGNIRPVSLKELPSHQACGQCVFKIVRLASLKIAALKIASLKITFHDVA